jgi:ABC-type anion transport system duplicated permease subunit
MMQLFSALTEPTHLEARPCNFSGTIASTRHKAMGHSFLATTTSNFEVPRSKLKATIMNIVVMGGSDLIERKLAA